MIRNAAQHESPPPADGRPRLRALVAVSLALAVAGCNKLPGKPNPADRPLLPAQRTDFDYLFAKNCSGCHGADGTLGPAPPLADPLFLTIVPEEQMLRVVTDGRSGTPMPAFARQNQGALTEQQIKILVTGIRQRWTKGDLPAAKPPEYLVAADAEPASAAAVERGSKLFAQACAICHGTDGKTEDPDAKPGGLNNPALLTLISNQALRRIIITGRHDLGMPNFADGTARGPDFQPLSSDDVTDLVALLASWREGGSPPPAQQAKNE